MEEVTITQGNTESNGIVVRNLTKNHKIDIDQILGEKPDISLKKDGSIEVLIYHTHSSEAYLAEESGTYYSDMPTRSQGRRERDGSGRGDCKRTAESGDWGDPR